MSRTHYFTNHRNVPMLAVLIPTGGTYGLRRADGTRPRVADLPMIEFWDARYDHDAEYHAQFVQRYYVDTLAGTRSRATGLLLDTSSFDWTLSDADVCGALDGLITVGQTVKFAEPMGDDEAKERFVVIELRDPRVLVEFICEMNIRPQSVYLIEDLIPA